MSKTKLHNAQFSINELIKKVQNYSYASKADMKHMLIRCIKDLHAQGYMLSHIKGLKPKHIYVLVEHWKNQGKSTATIKNYMSKLRKVSLILEKPKLVKENNECYQIEKRQYTPRANKALHHLDLSKCSDPMIRLSLEAQSLFGLRREESMKLVISEAWKGDSLMIKSSWTKGGIGRVIEITNEAQRQWLGKAQKQVPFGQSLIPKERSYKQHLSRYQQQTKLMGIKQCHGLRYAYAQRRYHELTKSLDPKGKGLICPLAGGKADEKLSDTEKKLDVRARRILSRNLGHSRISITRIYLG